MWNFDLAKTKAGQELMSIVEKRNIVDEINRIQDLYSKGAFADSVYKKLIEPLEKKLAMLENVAMQDLEHEETGAAAIS